jgi:hypothetical protein
MSNRLGDHYNRYSKSSYSEYNTKQYDQNNFNNAYNPSYNVKHSLTQEPDIEYEEFTHYLSVSSRDRNRNSSHQDNIPVWSNVNHYSITFPLEFRNISSVELIQAIIPATNDADKEPYLLLDIDEIPDVMISNDKYISDSFAMLQPNVPTTTGGFMQIDKRIHENTVKNFKTPKANLSKMTISIRDCTGNLFDFGSDTNYPNPVTKTLQNTFIFKIITLEKRRAELKNRGVF